MQPRKRVRSRLYGYLGIISVIMVLGATQVWSILSPKLFSYPHLIDTTYEMVVHTQSSQVQAILQNFQLPWQNPLALTKGFEMTAAHSPAAQAFAAGLWSGQQTLLGNNNPSLPSWLTPPLKQLSWLQTAWQRDFELGQWILLLWTVTQISPALPSTFWEQQQQIFTHFQADFSTANPAATLEIQRVISALKFIKPLLEEISAPVKQKPPRYDQLGRELAFMMDNLSP